MVQTAPSLLLSLMIYSLTFLGAGLNTGLAAGIAAG